MPPVFGKLELGFGRLDVVDGVALAEGKLVLDLTSDAIALRDLSGRFGNGSVLANVKLQRQGSLAALTGNVALKDVEAAAILGKGVGGRLSGRMEAGSSGESVAALVANMSGGGELRSVGSSIARLDPAGMGRGIGKLMAQDPIRAEATVVRDTVARELDASNWPLSEAVMPLTLAGGTLRFGPVTIEDRNVQLRLAGSVELGPLTLDARGLMVSRQLPAGWSGAAPEIAVSWRGPLTAPSRSVEAAALANGLAVIALARELDRIDKLEADAKERAERIRQLRLERERLAAEKRAAEQQDGQERNSPDGGGSDPATTGGTNNLPLQAPLPPAVPPVPVSPRSELPTIVPSFVGDEDTAIGRGEGEAQERASLSSHGVRPVQPVRVPTNPAAVGMSMTTGTQPLARPRTTAPLDLTPPGSAPLR
nr:AsmA-like C-terminal region-containing protein [Chelatococcus sp. YT9]